MTMPDQPALNTDRELWREREGDYYADSIHVTEQGAIGINCGGMVYIKTLRAWHSLAARENGIEASSLRAFEDRTQRNALADELEAAMRFPKLADNVAVYRVLDYLRGDA